MTELSRYRPSDVTAIATSLQRDIEDGAFDAQALTERLAIFKFRDKVGAYWTVEPRTSTWHTFAQGAWSPAPAPKSLLEGPAYQAVKPVPDWEPAIAKSAEPQEKGASRLLLESVAEVRQAYDRGLITSSAAETLASLFYLVDLSARLWTAGVHSGRWYYFEGGKWNQASSQPDPSQISTHSYSPRICQSCNTPAPEGDFCGNCGSPLPPNSEAVLQVQAWLAELVSSGRLIPEPIAEPFNPPPDFPGQPSTSPGQVEQVCPHCGWRLEPGSLFCNNCGQPVGGRPTYA